MIPCLHDFSAGGLACRKCGASARQLAMEAQLAGVPYYHNTLKSQTETGGEVISDLSTIMMEDEFRQFRSEVSPKVVEVVRGKLREVFGLSKPAEWTKEPPTEPGGYWTYYPCIGEINGLVSVRVYLEENRNRLELTPNVLGGSDYVNHQPCYWMKMVVPQPPKE